MSRNPELVRNLWLQLSAQRLVAAPAVLAIIFGLIWLSSGDPATVVGMGARWGFLLFALVWGTRRAADSIAEEVNTGTWDGQRMSALGAWTMVWGKLLGSTAYTWYCGLLCLAVYAAARAQAASALELAADLVLLLEAALLGQTVAMGASLALWRKRLGRRPLRWAAGQLVGILVGAVVATRLGVIAEFALAPPAAVTAANALLPAWRWYGLQVDVELFRIASTAVFFGWAVLGLYRLMLQELQYRTRPWAWIAFVLFCLAYAGGFAHEGSALLTAEPAGWRWSVPGLAVALVYVALFIEPKSTIRYRQFLSAARRGDGARAFAALPLWLPTWLIAAAALLAAALAGGRGAPFGLLTPLAATAQLLFMLRDIAFVLALNFGRTPGRADLPAFVYLAITYLPLGWLLAQLHEPLLALVMPVGRADALVTLAPVSVELLLAAGFLWYRWNRYGVPRVAGMPMARTAATGA